MAKKIIVIEDNHDILDMISYILEDEGYEVLPSLNSEPLKDIETSKPDLILLDDWLPDSYGHRLCATLKQNPVTAHIPVLLISSVINLPELAKKANADGFITKPFDIDHLISMVKEHLS
ncbi:response regulator [Mucilaginibacter sp. HMF5004]|uniref:response regulator n=1 Tax=Mucilaginibacter rivuli TaxID=2857527 RepID=UPI001C5E01CF|nr:response regulator [Mucilaginibacter rivuli]MBW4889421.1 response regulator [Mucilaginibacter rivuli]